jgi:aldose 1-epimerase
MHFKPLILAGFMALGCAQVAYAETTPTSALKKVEAVKAKVEAAAKLSVAEAPFGKLPSGETATLYTLTNANGVVVKVSNYGGVITSIHTPDKDGKLGDIVLGFDDVDGYVKNPSFFGALIGRFGNRIAKGQFNLDGKQYQLTINDGVNHLHGGTVGFDKVLWKAKSFKTEKSVGITLTHFSPDGDQGYPGNLNVSVVYELTNNNEFELKYKATTDKATPINMTQHPYFNLAGSGSILDQELMINGSRYTPIDSTLIPTGELAPVAGTPFDFTTSHTIGKLLNQENEQLKNGGGYDHNWVLNKKTANEWGMDARFYDPKSGRVLEVYSDEPGIQFYSGNFLTGKVEGKGVNFAYRGAICLEPQHFPDSPNKANFPSTILKPGTEYNNKIAFKFLVKK